MKHNVSEIVISNYRLYFEIALYAHKKTVESANKRNELISKENIDHGAIIQCAKSVHMQSTIAIVFSTMALEAFINEYGINSSSSSFFKTHIDQLNLISKILLLPRLQNKETLNTDSQEYEDLKWLINLRNELVHYRKKTRKVKDIDYSELIEQKDFMFENHSEKAIKTVRSVLKILDPKALHGL